MLKKILMIMVLAVLVYSSFASQKEIELEHLNLQTFKEKIFDYKNSQEWEYKGELPAIIDFYADWCGPCQIVAPIMAELSQEYEGKIAVYKIDTEDQRELAGMFGIRSIPAILFIPKEGKPQMSSGALPKDEYAKMIKEILKVE
jgi:thioredoxin 1